jgi:SAM-dependent methyltransferase
MPKDSKTYDEYAVRWAQRLRSKENVAHGSIAIPAMHDQLPDLNGKRVLCVGCATGEECREIKDRGASSVLGIDNASGLIEFAKQSYPDLDFETMAMEDIDFPEGSFDFVYSNLTMHYAQSWTDILRRIRTALVPGGEFLFSTHHPVLWGMEKSHNGDRFSRSLAYTLEGNDFSEIHGDYLTERKINDVWFNELNVSYWHRPMSSLVRDIVDSGFQIVNMLEPKPIEEAKAKKKNFWAVHQQIPWLLMFRLRKI